MPAGGVGVALRRNWVRRFTPIHSALGFTLPSKRSQSKLLGLTLLTYQPKLGRMVPTCTQDEKTSHYPGKFSKANPGSLRYTATRISFCLLARPGLECTRVARSSTPFSPGTLGREVKGGGAVRASRSCINAQSRAMGTVTVLWATQGNVRFRYNLPPK